MPPTPLWVLGQSPLPSPLAPFCFFFALPPSFWGRRRRPRPARGGRGGGGGRGARARLVTAERGEEEEGGIKEGERGGKGTRLGKEGGRREALWYIHVLTCTKKTSVLVHVARAPYAAEKKLVMPTCVQILRAPKRSNVEGQKYCG